MYRYLRQADEEVGVRAQAYHLDWTRELEFEDAIAFNACHTGPSLAQVVDNGDRKAGDVRAIESCNRAHS